VGLKEIRERRKRDSLELDDKIAKEDDHLGKEAGEMKNAFRRR
jgi:hypothetical protein